MKKNTLLIIVLMAFGIVASGQNTVTKRTCGTMNVNSAKDIEAFEKFLAPHLETYNKNLQLGPLARKTVYYIPTIVHVIHNSNEGVGSGRNISNARIQEQMQILNDDFRRTNSDANGTWSQAADCEINFCLVNKYPSGHPNAGQTLPERGVDRVSTSSLSGINNTSSGYSQNTIDNSIKPVTSWNPNEVMNIWVCQLQSGLLGYATFPNSGPADEDGTVMGYQYFGKVSSSNPFHKGRTTTHEVGHWLGLYHIWGDDFGFCSGSDQVSDTPNQADETSGCPTGSRIDACSSSLPGYMYQNYMDYTNDACMNLFTEGQKARMQATMASANRRSTLSSFSATLCVGVAVDELANEDNIKIYPNPAKNKINIDVQTLEDVQVHVYNVVGKLIYSNAALTQKSTFVDLSNEPTGVYFVKVKVGKSMTSKKIMLIR